MSTENINEPEEIFESLVSEAQARRDFLKKAGRFAAVTPPSITLLLGTSLNSAAIAKSSGSRPGNGGSPQGNGGGDKNHNHRGPPGQVYRFEGHSDSYGGGSHGGSRSGDPN